MTCMAENFLTRKGTSISIDLHTDEVVNTFVVGTNQQGMRFYIGGDMGKLDVCECGGEIMEDESGQVCLSCGWWPGRETPPGELINGVLSDCHGRPMTSKDSKPRELLRRQGEHSPEVKAAFAEMARERAEAHAKLPAIRAAGVEALKRLLPIAQGNSGQCRHVAAFLLGLYNGIRFKFDLTDFRALDRKIFNDCMAVLAMDYQPQKEVHLYFDQGNDEGHEIFEALAKSWGIRDYTKDGEPS